MSRFLSAALILFASGLLAAEPEGDLKALQGEWIIQEATLGGREHTDDFKSMKLSVTNDKYKVAFGEISENGTLELDPNKKPKQITLTTREGGPFKGRKLPGIYEFKGETIVLCLNSEMPDRPTKFDAPEKTKIMLLTFQRSKK
jgi:uncharacterized protein (TIGR03067 family)